VFERLVQHLRVKLMNPFKLVLITGGSSGIGLALAKLLVSQGADVCLLARDQVKLNQAQESLSSLKTRKNQKIDLISVNISNYGALSLELEIVQVTHDDHLRLGVNIQQFCHKTMDNLRLLNALRFRG